MVNFLVELQYCGTAAVNMQAVPPTGVVMIKGVICIKIGIKDYGYFLFMVQKFMYENQDLELINIIDGINIKYHYSLVYADM